MFINDVIHRVRKIRVVLLLFMPMFFLLPSCAKTPAPIPPGTDTFFYGYIVEGEKFGIKIGDTRTEVEKKINPEFFGDEDLDMGECDRALSRQIAGCDKDTMVGYYRVRKLLKDGFIFVFYKNGVVVGIAWEFDWLPPMDF